MVGKVLWTFFDPTSFVAAAVLAVFALTVVRVATSSFRGLQKILVLVAVLGFLLFAGGCSSEHTLTYSDTTPKQNVLKVIGEDGQVIEIAMNQEIDSKSLIALQTALSNRLVIDAAIDQQQAQQRRHDSDLRALYWVLFAIILSLTFLGREYLRQRSKDHD